MSARCTACTHPKRDDLDAAIVAGQTLRAIGKQYGMSASAVLRHRNRHLSPALAAMQVAREQRGKATAEEQFESLIDSAQSVLDAALKDGRSDTALRAVARLEPLVEKLGKMRGEIKDQPLIAVNLLSSPEIQAALAIVFAELYDLPEVRQRIASKLQPERLQLDEAPQ